MCKHTVWEQSCHFSDCEDTQLFKSHTHTHTHTDTQQLARNKEKETVSHLFT